MQFHSFDNAYLERLRSGDSSTQQHFQAYFTSLMRLKLRSRLRSPEAVEDVCQETFKRFFQALGADKIQQPERLGSFVNSMCNYVLLEHYRTREPHASLDDDDNPMDFPTPAPDPLATFTVQEAQCKVREVLDQLSELDRRLLREVFLEERDKDTVCQEFGVKRDYLRVLLHRAKKSFKSLYAKKEGKGSPAFPAA